MAQLTVDIDGMSCGHCVARGDHARLAAIKQGDGKADAMYDELVEMMYKHTAGRTAF